MTDVEKLRILLPHWIEHNKEHAIEFLGWAEKASLSGHKEVAHIIRRAAKEMSQANITLRLALDKLDGPVAVEPSLHSIETGEET